MRVSVQECMPCLVCGVIHTHTHKQPHIASITFLSCRPRTQQVGHKQLLARSTCGRNACAGWRVAEGAPAHVTSHMLDDKVASHCTPLHGYGGNKLHNACVIVITLEVSANAITCTCAHPPIGCTSTPSHAHVRIPITCTCAHPPIGCTSTPFQICCYAGVVTYTVCCTYAS
jgi:hypothetical protein